MVLKRLITPHQNRIIFTVFDLSERADTPYATVQEVAELMKKPESSIRTTIYGLMKNDYLKRSFRGAYILTEFSLNEVIRLDNKK
jgi:Mn-dependent DtxR family transcriptional regulator